MISPGALACIRASRVVNMSELLEESHIKLFSRRPEYETIDANKVIAQCKICILV